MNNFKDSAIISHRTSIDVDKSQTQSITVIENVSNYSSETYISDFSKTSSNLLAKSIEKSTQKSIDEPFNDHQLPSAEIDESNVDFTQNRELWQRRAENLSTSSLPRNQRYSEPYHLQRQNHTPDLVMDLPLVGIKDSVAKSMSVLSNLSSPPETPSPTGKSGSDVESPEMQTAAETFAKQNQCTLKKNTKIHIDSSIEGNEVKELLRNELVSELNTEKIRSKELVRSESINSEMIAITSPMTERKYATIGGSNSCTTTTTFKPQPKTKPLVLKKPVYNNVPLRSVSIDVCNKDPPDLPT